MTRQTCRARELTDDSYIYHRGQQPEADVRHIAKAYTAGDFTEVIYADRRRDQFDANGVVALATDEEITAYRREQDRFAVARALSRLGSQICDRGLPVPPCGTGIVVSLYLADDADLEPWADYLQARPRRGTALPLIQADAEGVEINVYRSGEFGPDLADAALTESVEKVFGPMYADPIAACLAVLDLTDTLSFTCRGSLGHEGAHFSRDHEHEWVDREQALAEMPERDGWAPPSGHSVTASKDAYETDRYSGGTEG